LTAHASSRPRARISDAIISSILVVLILLTLYPFIFMLITSTKSYSQFIHHYWMPVLPFHIGENYSTAWEQVNRYLLNTIYVATVAVTVGLLTTSLSGFVFARFRFPGKNLLFSIIMLLMMIPGILQLIPQFMWVRQMGLLNTYWALILPYIAAGQAYSIYVLRTFFASLPQELFDAAKIDGATDFQTFYQLAMPLSKGILGTLAILRFTQLWNDLIWPMVATNDRQHRTITVGLYFFRGGTQTQYGAMFAGYFMGSIPLLILFALFMRQFMAGITSGAIKA
jgi:ABC-type glycerol-3-phosphate transport system permease component